MSRCGSWRSRRGRESASAGLGLFGPSGAARPAARGDRGPAHAGRGRDPIVDASLLATRAGIDVPPRARRIGYVPQDALLFPHLDVEPQRPLRGAQRRAAGGVAPRRRDPRAGSAAVAAVTRLSGGEKQRVALARALMPGRGVAARRAAGGRRPRAARADPAVPAAHPRRVPRAARLRDARRR